MDKKFTVKRLESPEAWVVEQKALWARMGLEKSPAVEKEFFHCGLAAYDAQAEICCVAVLFDNPHLHWEGKAAACFGHFDSLNNAEAVREMLESAQKIAAELGKGILIGPMNGSTWADYRLAVDGFDQYYTLDLQHPTWYPDLLRQAGLEEIAQYVTQIDQTLQFDESRVEKAHKQLEDKQVNIRSMNLEKYEAELEQVYIFCMESFSRNLLFSPISKATFLSKYLPLKSYLSGDYILMAENESQELVGLFFALPNFADRQRKGMIYKTIAIQPGLRYAGLATIMGEVMEKRIKAAGFEYAMHAFMEAHNRSVNLSHYFCGVDFKRYALFGIRVTLVA